MELIFNVDERPESIWTDGNDPEFDSTELAKFPKEARATLRFLIRPMNKVINEEIMKKNITETSSFEFINGKRTTVKSKDINWDGVQEDQLDHAIESWEGFKTKNGPINCNRENKILWSNNYPGIAAACIRLSGSILSDKDAERIKQQEESEKNLLSGLNGQPTDTKK